MRPPAFTSKYFWGVDWEAGFVEKLEALLGALKFDNGIYASDSLVVWGRNLGFAEDERFIQAWRTHAQANHERGILWRSAVVVWAARQARRREGDFVELGCYAGTTARILVDTLDLNDRPVFLYDLFEHEADMAHHAMPEHGPELFERTRARFADRPNVRVIKGRVPDSFAEAVPERIAFVHMDMNNAEAEIAALDAIERRLSPGAVLLFDDFGQLPYRQQHLAERAWFAARGVPVLELPTGQGLAIW